MPKPWSRNEKTLIAISGALLLCLIALILAFVFLFSSNAAQRKAGLAEEELRLLGEKNDRLQGQIKRLKDDITENAGRLKSKEEQLADAERVRLELEEQRRQRLEAEKQDQELLKAAQQKVQSLLSAGQGSVFLKGDVLTVRLTNNVLFASGRASLSNEGMEVMKAVAQLLNSELKDLAVKVEGHTDNEPIGQVLKAKYPSNWDLSSARASSAIVFLTENGVDPNRLQAVGRADTAPVEPNDTETGRAANRRIDFVVDLKASLPKSPSP
jgi:chemotaxis protein MotB